MSRVLIVYVLSLGLTVGCTPGSESNRDPVNPGRSGTGGNAGGTGEEGGTSGGGGSAGASGRPPGGGSGDAMAAGTGGAGASSGGSGGAAAGAAGGGAAGGGASMGGTGGTGGAGGALATDGPVATDGPGADAGPGDAGEELGGEPVEGKPWLRLCPKADSQEKCCAFLCACLDKHCSDSPKDAPRLGGCMSMCMKLSDFRARCQVFHCFESNNPKVPQDHDSHCGHASGRVGGGSCRAIEQQK